MAWQAERRTHDQSSVGSKLGQHSGTSSSKQADMIFFAIFLFVLNLNYNLCDDVCEEKNEF
jgi:hypothetical protein